MSCEAVHTELGVTCQMTGRHYKHYYNEPMALGDGVSWLNEDWVPLATPVRDTKASRAKAAKDATKAASDAAREARALIKESKAADKKFNQPGQVREDHPFTSQESARLTFSSQRFRVLSVIEQAGIEGATAAEVSQAVGIVRNQTATRLSELRVDGHITYAEIEGVLMTRSTGPRSRGLVQFITQSGREALAEADDDTNTERTHP